MFRRQLTRMPFVAWAHQGGAAEAPSNMIPAFQRVLDSFPGMALELDVHSTLDRRLVVIHDRTLDRTTEGHGRVAGHRAGRLAQLGVPRLTEVLALRPHPDTTGTRRITIEVKSWRAARSLVEVLLGRDEDDLDAVWTDWGDVRFTVTSFFDPFLWRIRWHLWTNRKKAHRDRIELAPGTGYLALFWVLALFGLHPPSSRYARIQIPVRKGLVFGSARFVQAAQQVRTRGTRNHLQVDVWTIDDQRQMGDLIGLGVNGIMTDCPSRLAPLVPSGGGVGRARGGTAEDLGEAGPPVTRR